MDFALTDEQQHFVAAIRDFCARECGTQEQREKLTDGYSELHNFDLYSKMAELGWLGVTIPEEYGGSGGSMLDACLFMEETSRGLAPIGGYATTLIVAGATQRFGTEEQKAEILGGIAARLGRGDRDDRARGRLRRRLADRPRPSGSTAASSSTGRRSSAPTPTSPTTSSSSAGPPRASPSTRA